MKNFSAIEYVNFEKFKNIIRSVDVPAQRLGIFNVKINNRGKKYDFHCLKESITNNEDNFGFSLNHYGWEILPKQKYKKSKFHDEEDVCIDICKDEFIDAIVNHQNEILLKTKYFTALITIQKHKMKNLIGKKVKIISDNENYADFKNETLVITYASNSGKWYDSALYPEMLCDFEILGKPDKQFPFALYEYEFELLNTKQWKL
jgi:hypothetical protein